MSNFGNTNFELFVTDMTRAFEIAVPTKSDRRSLTVKRKMAQDPAT
jgi:hypothetical protein